MPESKSRKQPTYTPPPVKGSGLKPNPRWYAPLMVAFLVLGLAWVVVYYITEAAYPVPNITDWNLAIGFGVMLVGFGMTTRWR